MLCNNLRWHNWLYCGQIFFFVRLVGLRHKKMSPYSWWWKKQIKCQIPEYSCTVLYLCSWTRHKHDDKSAMELASSLKDNKESPTSADTDKAWGFSGWQFSQYIEGSIPTHTHINCEPFCWSFVTGLLHHIYHILTKISQILGFTDVYILHNYIPNSSKDNKYIW